MLEKSRKKGCRVSAEHLYIALSPKAKVSSVVAQIRKEMDIFMASSSTWPSPG